MTELRDDGTLVCVEWCPRADEGECAVGPTVTQYWRDGSYKVLIGRCQHFHAKNHAAVARLFAIHDSHEKGE